LSVKKLRVNEAIRVREVRLIDAEGNQAGVVSIEDALRMAQESELDLVEVSPNVEPPVCKLINYGKYMFELEKKTRESKKKQKIVLLKEIRMQPKIEDHDLEHKAKHIKEFLDDGDKVKVTIRFRGRELAHTELGRVVLDDVLKILGEEGFVMDKPPMMEGRFMSMILSPKVKK
jgi:translation initiation factor IF-3